MITPRTLDKTLDRTRPTLPQPKTQDSFGGWGPRLL